MSESDFRRSVQSAWQWESEQGVTSPSIHLQVILEYISYSLALTTKTEGLRNKTRKKLNAGRT